MPYVAETLTIRSILGWGGRPWGSFSWGDAIYEEGDYANLFGNLYGPVGWGSGAWGSFRWGVIDYANPLFARTADIENLNVLEYGASLAVPGLYIFSILTFDSLGNNTTNGVPSLQYFVCLEPVQPDPPGLLVQTAGPTLTLNR